MTMEKPDDLEAVRKLVETLKPFKTDEQERIIRWAREKIGLTVSQAPPVPPSPLGESRQPPAGSVAIHPPGAGRNIRSFVTEKKPTSDNQFAAVVAYYYRFEAPQDLRKEFITSEDLLESCRQAGRARLHEPGKTLNNAHNVGLLDKGAERGAYRINSVGENLVAMTLPGGGTAAVKRPPRTTRTRVATRKSPSKTTVEKPKRRK